MSLRAATLCVTIATAATAPSGAEPATPAAIVRAIDLDVEIDVEHGLIREEAAVTIDGSGVRSFVLELDPSFTLERTRVSSGVVDARLAGDAIRVVVDPPLDGPRTVRFVVSGRPKTGADDRITTRGAVLDPRRAWYPRWTERPVATRLRVRAPVDWTVAGPGAGRRDPDGTWRFEPERPVRDVAVVAAPGLVSSSTDVAGRRLRVVAPDDGPDAAAVAGSVSDPWTWFAATVSPYPFDGFNLAFVPGLPETVTGSGFVAVPLEHRPETASDLALLLAGQWYGQWLAGDGPWIRSFAAWHAWEYARDRRVPPPSDVVAARAAYLELPRSRDVALVRADATSPDAVVLGKGSAAPAMVRHVVGHRAFDRAIADLALLAPARIDPDAFRALLRAAGDTTSVATFDEWFARPGVPELRVRLRAMKAGSGGYRADVDVEQTGDVYRWPLDVTIVGADEQRRETLELSERSLNVYYLLPFEPRRIEVDPLGRLFQRPPRVIEP